VHATTSRAAAIAYQGAFRAEDGSCFLRGPSPVDESACNPKPKTKLVKLFRPAKRKRGVSPSSVRASALDHINHELAAEIGENTMRKLMLIMTLSLLFALPSFPQSGRARATNCPPVGQHQTFTAMWFTKDNHFYSTSISVSPLGVCRYKPGFFSGDRECYPISKVAAVRTLTGFASGGVRIESTGGGEPLVGDGFSNGDVKQIEYLILRYQRDEAECRMDGASR
jgi:hypothetical protein